MINLIGVLILIIVQILLVLPIVIWYRHKLNLKDNEIGERDKVLGESTQLIKKKNLEIKQLQHQLKKQC